LNGNEDNSADYDENSYDVNRELSNEEQKHMVELPNVTISFVNQTEEGEEEEDQGEEINGPVNPDVDGQRNGDPNAPPPLLQIKQEAR